MNHKDSERTERRSDRSSFYAGLCALCVSVINPLPALRALTMDNPVLVKEFRTRMRGARAYWVLLIYVLLLALVAGVTFMNWYAQTSASGASHPAAAGMGRLLFQILFSLQAWLVALITPAITAGALTIEREQHTYEILAASGLKPPRIIAGKLLAAVAFVLLLLTSSLPLVSLSFLLGGVSPGEVIGTYLSLALSAFVFGSIGILCSASFRATAAATVATYVAVLSLFFVTLGPGLAPNDTAPFRSVNAALAIYHSVDPEAFFRGTLPSWLVGVTLNLLMGLLFANLAMTRLEYFDDRRPLAVRGLATALWTAFVLVLIGATFGQNASLWSASASIRRADLVTLWRIAFGLLLLVLPIFTTGEWETTSRDEAYSVVPISYAARSHADPPLSETNHAQRKPYSRLRAFLTGMLPHAAFRAELPAGAPLLGLWLVITGALLAGGFAAMGRPVRFPWDTLPLLLPTITVIAAFAALGYYLSLIIPDRKATMLLSYLTIAALSLLPYFGTLTWEAGGRGATPHLAWQFLYLAPFFAFTQLSDPGGSFWSDHPPMLLGQTPLWLVTGAIYATLAALLFALTLRRLARRTL